LDAWLLTDVPDGGVISKYGSYKVYGGVQYHAAVAGSSPYFSFSRSLMQYIDVGTQSFRIQSNGGFTAIIYFALTGSPGSWERVFEFSFWKNGIYKDNIIFTRVYARPSVSGYIFNDRIRFDIPINAIQIAQNNWQLIVMKYSSTTRLYSVYQNGNLIGSTTLSQVITDKLDLNIGHIGRSNWDVDAYLNANLAGLYMYDRYLTDAEVASVSNNLKNGGNLKTEQT
jgi:hypothetical protein